MNIIEDSVGEYYGESFDLIAYPKSVFENALELNKYFEVNVNSYMLKI